MLWTVRLLWLSGDRFYFNCYCHWSLIVLWNGNGTASFLHSREGVVQGEPLAIITYGINILPLINNPNGRYLTSISLGMLMKTEL